MRLAVIGVAIALGCAGTAQASSGNMTVAEFLTKAYALKARGLAAMFSADYRLLRTEAEAAARGYGLRLAAERSSGRPSSCPPKSVHADSNRVISWLETYPTAERGRIDLHQAVADYYQRTWPCRRSTLAGNP
jgi:hypothetical protein